MSGDANHIFTIYWSSVIVDDFHLIRAIVRPDKADAILVIDPDTVLSPAISRQRLQAIARRHTEFFQGGDRV